MLVHDGMTNESADAVAAQLGDRLALRWDDVAQHVPVELAERARAAASEHAIDAVVTIGGGSSTGLAKALALSHRVPIVAVPDDVRGKRADDDLRADRRSAQADRQGPDRAAAGGRLRPRADARTAAGGHRTVGVQRSRPLGRGVVGAGLQPDHVSAGARRACGRSPARSRRRWRNPTDVDARGDLLYGAALSGMALGATAAGLHHKICHVLGGRFNLVHADAHSVILPHALAFNAPVLPDEMGRLADGARRARSGSGGRAVGSRRRQQRADPTGRPEGQRRPAPTRPTAGRRRRRRRRDHGQPATRDPRRPARNPRTRLRRATTWC